MTDDINKKISIDVEINTDGQQQIDQYKASFDGLRNSINNLGKPLNDLTDSINKLDTQNKTASSSGNGLIDTMSKISKASGALNTAINFISDSLESFEGALTGGLTILIAFAPEIIKWVSNLFKGDTTIKSLNQTLREHRLVLQAVNDARLKGDQNAQSELINLKLLYSASQNQKLALTERKKAVNELQAQYPAYFGNISTEAILAGNATTAYNNLTKAILASARAKAAEDMMVKNSQRQLGDEATVNDLKKKLDAKNKELAAAQKEQKDINNDMQGSNSFGVPLSDTADDAKIERLTNERDTLQKTIWDASNDSLILNKQNQALAADISKNIEKNGIKTITSYNNQTAAADKFSKKLDEVKHKQNTSVNKNSKAVTTTNIPVSNNSPDPNASYSELGQADDALKAKQAQKNEEDAKKNTQDIITAVGKIKAEEQQKEEQAKKARSRQLRTEALNDAKQVADGAFSILQNSIKRQSDAKIAALEQDKASELNNSALTGSQKIAIEQKYKTQEAQVKKKAFKDEQEVSIAQAVINGALAVTKATSQTGILSPLVVPEIIAETAVEIAKIATQKPPAYARGGLHYTSDGRGGVLPGYSRTDNTNAYLRSGEGIIVSEAMRNPWARNLVSAINVGFGGRDFSAANPGRGYAVGGIFTDGGDANRYYNQPANNQKNLANTLAYQMINNFPPVYVDVKDINNQQNILAQTINRVNL